MSKILQQKAAEIEAKRKEAAEFYDKLDSQVDEKGEPTPITEDDKKFIKDLNKTIEEMEEKYKDLEEIEIGRGANAQRLKEMNRPVRGGTDYDLETEKGRREASKSITDFLLSDEQFKAWREQVVKGGGVQSAKFNQSPAVFLRGAVKTLITGGSATSAGALIENDRKPIVDAFYQRPLTIRDLVTQGETDSDTVTFARVTSVTNNAAPTAEATATGDGTGNKPESGMAFEEVSESVKTIPHWVPATRQALADAAQLRTLIEEFLRYGIDEELEDQMLSGSGTGANFTGVYNTSGIQTQAFATDALTSLRKARTKLRTVGRVIPTAWVMHPNDWETIDLLKDNESRYIYGGPAVLGNPRVWGLPVVESEGATEGLPIGADWRKAVLWDRMMTSIYVSDSHSDFFTRNLIAILAEMRAAFGVIRPKAFITVDVVA
jgi:HK97 family phage major capsid protein